MRLRGIVAKRKGLHVRSGICGGPAFEMLTRGQVGLMTLDVILIIFTVFRNYAEMLN